VLAGDVGGTNARFRLYDLAGMTMLDEVTLPSSGSRSMQALLGPYLEKLGVSIRAAVLGIAGPVVDGVSRTTNLPWVVDERKLAEELDIPVVRIVNDLAAIAMGCTRLGPSDTTTIWAGKPAKAANCAVITAGTGLGEALIVWDGQRYVPSAAEGGHADFAPRTEMEIEFHRYVRGVLGREQAARARGAGPGLLHVSYERVLSGPGLGHLYDFFAEKRHKREPSAAIRELESGDRNAAISALGLSRRSPAATEAVDAFAAIYGAEAGNLSLKGLALGGLFLCGRIAQEIVPRRKRIFLSAMQSKGRMRSLVRRVPVTIVNDELVGLLGASYLAAGLVSEVGHGRRIHRSRGG